MGEMFPTVEERKKNIHVFMNYYPYLCRLQNIIPNPNIKVDSSNNVLDFFGDRLKLEDWKPVLDAISNDKSLHCIGIRSRHSKAKVAVESDTEIQVRQLSTPKLSPLFTSYILTKITESVSKCLKSSPALTVLVLERIPLNLNSLIQLTEGLEACHKLQQLSLPYTQLGDDQCEGLCHVLRHRLNLVWLNLTGCGLTEKGVGSICNLLKFQKLNRYGESWKQSLRYRPVNPNIMPGLRRVTLNHNPIGDAGVKIFVETLLDDLWLKALDLQYCNITMVGGETLLNLVKENQFLSVVDVRNNMQVPKSVVAAVVQQLAENNRETTPEFQWLKEDNPKYTGRSNSGTSIVSRSTRLLSNTTISSKGLNILPNKARALQAHITFPHPRSSSAKRSNSANNTPRPPWNCGKNSAHNLKRGNSDQLIRTNSSCNQDIISELHQVKSKLQEVTQRLEEEKERRVKIENELEKYKHLLEFPDSSVSVNKTTLQAIFNQFYNDYLNKGNTSPSKNENDKLDNEAKMKKHDSLESVIKAVNGESPRNVALDLSKCNSSNEHSENESTTKDTPSAAQLLFERLIST